MKCFWDFAELMHSISTRSFSSRIGYGELVTLAVCTKQIILTLSCKFHSNIHCVALSMCLVAVFGLIQKFGYPITAAVPILLSKGHWCIFGPWCIPMPRFRWCGLWCDCCGGPWLWLLLLLLLFCVAAWRCEFFLFFMRRFWNQIFT